MAGSKGLVWKVALGVFLGLTACGLVTCTVVGALGLGYMKDRVDETDKKLNIISDGQGSEPLNMRARTDEMRRAQDAAYGHLRDQARAPEPARLSEDERCVGKTRLRRVENGWEQSGSCQ
jgi:hypothetical protein